MHDGAEDTLSHARAPQEQEHAGHGLLIACRVRSSGGIQPVPDVIIQPLPGALDVLLEQGRDVVRLDDWEHLRA